MDERRNRLSDNHLQVGIVRRAHGVRGEVRIEPTTDRPEARFASGALLRAAEGEYEVESARSQPDGSWLVKFAGTDTREQADALRGTEFSVPRETDELMRDDFVGFEVETAGSVIGRVESVENTGSADFLVVSHGAAELLVPLVAALGVSVDPDRRRVLIEDLSRIS